VDDAGVADLVERAVGGDREAFGVLYDLHVQRVYRYVLVRTRRHHDAEDVTEQVFLKAWLGIGTYQNRGRSLSAWLYQIASNACVDRARRLHQVVYLEPDRIDPACTRAATELRQVVDADELARALRDLAPDQRQTIELRFFQDLDYDEVAARMNKREGAVRALQMRALVSLRRVLLAKAA
jgi:RNA polymerase sigma-70 factor (ECF subfamily)